MRKLNENATYFVQRGERTLLSSTSTIYNTIQYIYFIPIKVPQGAITNIHS
jgi:hypothetical protein